MHMVRRISQRAPKNMDWGYTDEDLRIRDLDEDDHRLKQTGRSGGQDYYAVESLPRHASTHGKRITYFNKTGELLKQEFITRQRLNAAWIWDTAVMYNVRTKASPPSRCGRPRSMSAS
jgi:hypothetical protein